MNARELRFFSIAERQLPDCSALPIAYLLKSILVKLRRRLWGRALDRKSRLVWTVTAVSDAAEGPVANVRNYLDRKALRAILAELTSGRRLVRACEIGCGYGRLTMVLQEFATSVKGFEREPHLVELARALLPDIEFECVESLAGIADEYSYDVVMSRAVLQHLTDAETENVCRTMKRLASSGYILCVEKTEAISVTQNTDNGQRFISRARPVAMYEDFMSPFQLVAAKAIVLEATYHNPTPATCMLFASPKAVGRVLPPAPQTRAAS